MLESGVVEKLLRQKRLQDKTMVKKDYSKLEKDDLLKVIEKLESRKKY